MDPSSSKLHSWKISIRAKSKFFDLKLNASNVLPHLGNGGEKISLLLRLRRFLFLKVKSKNRATARRDSTLRSRLFKSLPNFSRRKLQRSNGGYSRSQGPMTAIMGSLSLLSHSTSENNCERITIHALAFMFYLVFLFQMRKTNLSLLLVATTISFIGFSLSCLSYTYADPVTKVVWKAWNNIISIGCLSTLSQVMHSRIHVLVHRNLIAWFIVLALLSLFLCQLRRAMLFGMVKCAIEGAPILISIVFLARKAFFNTLGDHKDPGVLGLCVSFTYFWGKKLIKILASCVITILS